MKIKSEQLIQKLADRSNSQIKYVNNLHERELEQLNAKPSAGEWSALECIEHLNLFGDYYIPELKERIQSSNTEQETYFKSGWIGNYFAESMKPSSDMTNMKTFKNRDPGGSELDYTTLDRFVDQQNEILEILERSRSVSLNKICIPISISRWIRFKLGDVLRVVLYHNQRHLVQADHAIESVTEQE